MAESLPHLQRRRSVYAQRSPAFCLSGSQGMRFARRQEQTGHGDLWDGAAEDPGS
jgi:hypothetical protein